MGKLRIVLTDKQKTVLDRMKRVQRVKGEAKEKLKADPAQIFDGVIGDVELPYGDRVIGIGSVTYDPVPKAQPGEGSMSELFGTAGPSGDRQESEDKIDPDKIAKKSLIVKDHTENVGQEYMDESEHARIGTSVEPYERPASLSQKYDLKPHQRDGVQWLQTCTKIADRGGVLLADDMGVGKTLQILSFLAWAIESGRFPDLSCAKPPFRPILIVAPLILLETEVWQKEMQQFFADKGEVFGNVLPLYGPELRGYIRKDAEGREDIVAKPILNLDRIQRNHVVITNYEAVRDYEFSFAYCPNGISLWSVVVTDEAQEYKTPNSKISHAMKALKPDFSIACTGTPVENRLLDMWNLFDTIQPGLLGSAREFSQKYESRQNDSLADLKTRLLYQKPHAFLLRRKKSEVLDLPMKSERKLDCVMSETEVSKHQSLIEGLSAAKRSKGRLDLLQKFARLYQHPLLLDGDGDEYSVEELRAGSSKLRQLLATLHEIRRAGEKAIIFARHKDMQRILARVLSEEFKKPVRIVNGDTPRSGSLSKTGVETRSRILEDFRKASGFDLVILSPFVAGVGLTIVEANHVIHYGRWWNPAVEAQATDRAYRLGQTKEVTVYLPILRDETGRISKSFDQLLDELMERKKGLAEGALRTDDFLAPQENEDEVGLQVCAGLEASVNPDAG
jgi:SNF2 family DNA or RNA helicase